ncbi:MAG TPA: AraC family transcriptional regulator [Pyrinomonadaceae bacterium]|nr:AraC family transcriptional regulator [Pyrinomonadaceae bacterium]
MAVLFDTDVTRSAPGKSLARVTPERAIPAGVEVVRAGKAEPFLSVSPTLSSTSAHWGGVTLENYEVPAVFIPRHEHPEHFLHIVVKGSVEYEVNTHGRTHTFSSRPGTTFLLPKGTVDEIVWQGTTRRVAVSIRPYVLTHALEETSHLADIELQEHWDLIDGHILSLVNEMSSDLDDGSPAGCIYGELLADALAVYLLKCYAVKSRTPASFSGGLPPYRLKRVLDYIGDNLSEDLSLSLLSSVADMSPHYFSALFKNSTGKTIHSYVVNQRIESAKRRLKDPERSIIDVGMDVGFQNPSHFARVFRKMVGIPPSAYQTEMTSYHSPAARNRRRSDDPAL